MTVPSFILLGKTIVTIADLNKDTKNVPFGMIHFNIETQVKIEESFKGFLTIGIETRSTVIRWDRRFCLLDGRYLKYWNYPQEEENGVAPMEVLNLEKCTIGVVNVAERHICARPRTLLLEIYKHTGIYTTILKRFLSADTIKEMKMWQTKINAIVSTLRNWGETRTPIGCFNKYSEI